MENNVKQVVNQSEILDWMGKVTDVDLSYDIGLSKDTQCLMDRDEKNNLPAKIYSISENQRDVVGVTWDKAVKKADQTDYMVAIACGTVAGLIDMFFTGEFSIERANKWGDDQVNKFVIKVANTTGYKGNDLEKAIKHMENKFRFAADESTPQFGGGKQHHLRDFSHHFSLGGWLCSMFTQFSGKVIGTDTNGRLLIVDIQDRTFIGKNFEEKILFGTVNWFFHMVSDMAGSNATPGKGTGIPGPFLSMIKELSALPCFRDKKIGEHEFYVWVSRLFNGTLLAKRDDTGKIIESVKFDLRTEIGILHEFGRQVVPVLINECLVRGIYFIRRLYLSIKDAEIQQLSDLKKIDTSELLPFNNRVVKRMITVASGTFTAIDIADAAVRSAIKNKGINTSFVADFAVRVNFVGIGRFIIACKADGSDIIEDIKEGKKQKKSKEKEYEKIIAELKCLTLNYEQMRLLYSLERLSVLEDVESTKKEDSKNAKKKWLSAWEKAVLSEMPIIQKEDFFIDVNEISAYINKEKSEMWLYLVTMEGILFKPYYPIHGDERDKTYKGLRSQNDFFSSTFLDIQKKIKKADVEKISRAHKHAINKVSGSTKNIAIGAIGTTAVVALSGGLAFAFAPVIATAIVGEAAAGLSGAALVSYSLAAVGGGSLAAGGLGMAGGTAIITGGGALVGMLGGTGISTVSTMALLTNDSYVLSECCRLVAFSKVVLADEFKAYTVIIDIQDKVNGHIDELEQNLAIFKTQDVEDAKTKRKKIQVAEKSLKYLKRCNEELKKIITMKA